MDELFPLTGLITPNLSEAAALAGFPVRTKGAMKRAARVIKAKTGGSVLIKGGHLTGKAIDLFFDGESFLEFSSPRIKTGKTHGTGCTFSTAIAVFWGKGYSLVEAVGQAKDFITQSIAGAQPVGHGLWPTDPYGWLQNRMEKEGVSS